MPKLEKSRLFLPKKYLVILEDLLKKHVPDAEVWAYGSRVTGKAHEGSDLDLVLRYKNNTPEILEGWSDLIEALQNSIIPIIIEVHLWDRLPESFYPNIEKAYIILQEAKV